MGKFVNPYHFVRMPSHKKLAENMEQEEKLSGYIDYTLTTKTPLFIPNSSSDKAFFYENDKKKERKSKHDKEQKSEHKLYDFFSYEKLKEGEVYDKEYHEPVIPGSEIRGMIRNIYETVTDSCFSAVNDNVQLYKRHADSFQEGLLRKNKDGTIDLVKAKVAVYPEDRLEEISKIPEEQLKKLKDGQKVYFQQEEKEGNNGKVLYYITEISLQNKEGRIAGYFKKGKKSPIKSQTKNIHVFYLDLEDDDSHLEDDNSDLEDNNSDLKDAIVVKSNVTVQMEELETVLATYADSGINKEHKGYNSYAEELQKFKEAEGAEYFPVYYSKLELKNDRTGTQEPLIYLSPASITKEAYYQTVESSLKGNERNLQPCESEDALCPACTLFGFVGERQGHSKASSLRFQDVRLKKKEKDSYENYYEPSNITLPELSSPKLSSTEFYLLKPKDADYWNYDYYMSEKNFYRYVPTIAGRKYYWHYKPDISKMEKGKIEKTNRNVTVRLLNSNVTFKGRIYFEKITEKQLKQIIWICNISNKKNVDKIGACGYKLGMGKPLGFGSVALSVESVKIRKFGRSLEKIYDFSEYEESREYIYSYEDMDFSAEIKESFLKLCNFNSTEGKTVKYPTLENGSAIFKWFVNNRGKDKIQKREEIEIKQVLGMLPENMELEEEKKEEKASNKSANGKKKGNGNGQRNNRGNAQGKDKGKNNHNEKKNQNKGPREYKDPGGDAGTSLANVLKNIHIGEN